MIRMKLLSTRRSHGRFALPLAMSSDAFAQATGRQRLATRAGGRLVGGMRGGGCCHSGDRVSAVAAE